MNKLQQQAYKHIQSRLFEILTAFKQGQDVSPATRFHTEGYVQACCELQLISVDEAFDLMAKIYRDVFAEDCSFPQQQTFQIPALMKRAPVYPST